MRSLTRAVIWGRSVYDAVRKFLQFQLVVNITAVVIVIISSLISTITTKNPQSALAAIQLLFINLVMNVFAALALATDKPSEVLLLRKPERKGSPLINNFMWYMIGGQAFYQLTVFFIIFLANESVFGRAQALDSTGVDVFRGTVVYNTFVLQQLFNEVNCRSITKVCAWY